MLPRCNNPKMPLQRRSRRAPAKRARRKRSGVSAATKKYVRRMMPKTELKRNVSYYDEISQSTLTQGSVTPMISITQGTGVNSRIGNQITVKGFQLRVYSITTQRRRITFACCWCGPRVTPSPGSPPRTCSRMRIRRWCCGCRLRQRRQHPLLSRQQECLPSRLGQGLQAWRVRRPILYSHVQQVHQDEHDHQYNGNNAGDGSQDKQLTLFVLAAESGDDVGMGQTVELSHVGRVFFTDA